MCAADVQGPGLHEKILENFKPNIGYCEPGY